MSTWPTTPSACGACSRESSDAMLLTIAWRNVWRNARRSVITMSALGVGVAGIVAIFSYREVANEAIVADVTAGLVGHLQVHALGYQEAPAIGLTVQSPVQVEA